MNVRVYHTQLDQGRETYIYMRMMMRVDIELLQENEDATQHYLVLRRITYVC